MSSFGHAHDCSAHSSGAPSVHQTLDEMEFERGIWSAAVSGDLEEVQRRLGKGENANRTDSSGYTALVWAIQICFMHTLNRNWLLCLSLVSSSLFCLFHKNIKFCFDNLKKIYKKLLNSSKLGPTKFWCLLLYRGKTPLLVWFETMIVKSLNPHRSS